MSGTRSPSKTAPAIDPRRIWWLRLWIWPFATGAVAINLFLLGLILHSAGFANIAPVSALVWSLPLGLPATWAAARWIGGLIAEAER
ncbi:MULTISPECIES: hypothetical protein [Gemmobacter]|jgi:hypothetical protein|uniref:Uncharacterized protein n=1 Tax=Gemmobacter caeni TaxID=589035 RepID=A0A2T6AWS0_9RHOB|nr:MULTISPECIES: hypothetical protein [Gemmobacter]OJY34940.1 MAG: hypothetical protein BGP11_16860 [Rhodobacterales bacterium 65-51]PTX48273.1 hypothetical protein C8N34_110133 [Gemmobacter caeni]TWI96861.1 hypothetical protein IQ03_03146 [Gemmobacter caeni]